MINRKIYCCWFGGEMSENRRKCYESIVNNSGVEVVLITDKNVYDFELPEHRFNKGFELLSDTMKSEYLRPYLMHYYGGGYTDIKQTDFDWNPYFDLLEQSDYDCIGYRERESYHVHYVPAQEIYAQLIGCGSYIHKKNTILSKAWMINEDYEMDIHYEQLKDNPGRYHPRAITGGINDNPHDFAGSKYPFRWNHLCSEVWHKTQMENLGRWSFDFPYINTNNYR